MKIITAFFIVVALLCAQGTVRLTTRADVTGAAAAVQVNTTGAARWLMIVAPSANSAVIRCGDSNVSTTRGVPVAAGGGLFYPPIASDSPSTLHLYNIATLYCYVATGDKVSFTWAE